MIINNLLSKGVELNLQGLNMEQKKINPFNPEHCQSRKLSLKKGNLDNSAYWLISLITMREVSLLLESEPKSVNV